MRKLSILLLLTVFLASFAFAIDGIGDFTAGVEFGFDNVGGGNGGALNVSIEPSIAFSRAFGAFGLSVTLGDGVYIPTDKTKNATDKIGDDLYINITPSYALAAGPGELGFGLSLQANIPITDEGFGMSGSYTDVDTTTFAVKYKNIFFRFDPSISYGLDAGFGALAFEVGTDHLQLSKAHVDMDATPPEQVYGLDRLGIYFKAGVDLSFGLGFWVKPVLGIQMDDTEASTGTPTQFTSFFDDETGLDNFVFDIHYAITDAISAGVETSIPTVEDGIKNDGITITPRGEFSFGPLGAYLKIELSKIAAQDANDDALDLQIKPILGVTYSF
jgi:hypothetical protein